MLGGEIVSTFDDPAGVKLGSCKLIEEIMIGEDRLIHFSGVALGEACTIVLRGASTHILDEADRSLHDALCVLQVGRIVGSRGSVEVWIDRGLCTKHGGQMDLMNSSSCAH